MKSWRHLVVAIRALNVVVTGKGGLVSVKESDGTHLFCMRREVIQGCDIVRFEQFVKNCREQLAKQASN